MSQLLPSEQLQNGYTNVPPLCESTSATIHTPTTERKDTFQKLLTVLRKNWHCVRCKQKYMKNKQKFQKKRCVKCMLNYKMHLNLATQVKENLDTLETLNL